MAEPKAGQIYGDWKLIRLEGQGRNGWVWRADREGNGEEAALKILKARRPEAEPYQRFRREVTVLGELGDRPGILPLRDAYVPERLGKDERAWFVMPLAERVDTALAESDLREVVSAFASFARVLAELFEERRLSHRDLKPQNLYRWGGQFVVGDFGLVDTPDAESLTAPGRIIGPVNYIPWELLQNPDDADSAPADVYMLTKALWVVAASQRWPPPGPQPAGSPLSVSNFRPHPRSELLDQIIERGTLLQPSDRLSMLELEQELKAWVDMPEEPPRAFDLTRLAAELRSLSERQLSAQARDRQRREATLEAFRLVEQRLGELAGALNQSLPQVRIDTADQSVERQIGFYPTAGPQPVVQYAIGVWSEEVGSLPPLQLHFGVSLTLLDNGDLRVVGLLTLGNQGESLQKLWTSDELCSPVGGAESRGQLEMLLQDLEASLPDFARAFAEQLS